MLAPGDALDLHVSVGRGGEQLQLQDNFCTEINDYLLDQVFALPLAERSVIWLTRNRLKAIAPIGRQMFKMPDTWLDG